MMTSGPEDQSSISDNNKTTQTLALIENCLQAAKAVQIIGHVRPDGDCIGSMLAMHHLLDQWGVPNAMAAEEMPSNGYSALDDFGKILIKPDPRLDPEQIVYVDCATLDRGISNWTPPAPIINIDHHAGNTRYGEINWIEPKAAATGEMLYELMLHARTRVTVPIAEALLIALTTDTGSFRFSNTGPHQHIIAACLLEAGASVDRISRIAFGSQPPQSMKLTGHVLSAMRLECEGRLVWSEIRKDVCAEHGGEGACPENLADALRNVHGVKVSLLFHEMLDGALRLNLRSDGEINVGRLASQWGGGGHPCAAGLYLAQADYEKDRDRLLQSIRETVGESEVRSPESGVKGT